jgi:hypothetical protein
MSNIDSSKQSKSRYVNGGTVEKNNSYLNWWERKTITPHQTDRPYPLNKEYIGRLDLLASVIYGDSRVWWIIAQRNLIIDPTTELYEGKVLYLPDPERVNLLLSTASNSKAILN